MIREAKEECGLDVKIKKAGKVYEYYDDYGRVIAIPFLLESNSSKVKLSFEHSEYRWIEPKDLKNYDCVPDLVEDVKIFGLV
jgi:8-oxo-dGTP pyrophosphatase MutT (NUDIX family)